MKDRRNRWARRTWAGLFLAAALVTLQPTSAAAQHRPFGDAGHWCTFNRPCNWTAHAAIAFGTTYALDGLNVPLPLAAGVGAGLFLGKEIRDHLKWGDFWTFDSLVDLASGVVGAGAAYLVLRPDPDARAEPYRDAAGRTGLSMRLAF